MLERLMLINGEWVPASDGAVKQSVNPATGEVLGTAPLATHEDVERALDAARAGQNEWAACSQQERSVVLRRAADLFDDRLEEIAQSITAETPSFH